MSKTKNEITTSSKELGNQIVPNLFNDIDFNGLNNAIDNMAAASGDLSESEKQVAGEIIDNWNDSVVSRLDEKTSEMESIIDFFNAKLSRTNMSNMELEDFGPALAEKTNTKQAYDKITNNLQDLDQLEDSKPQKPAKSEKDTLEEDIKKQNKYEAERAVHKLKEARLEQTLRNNIGKWKREMNESDVVADMLRQARKFMKASRTMYNEANDKAQLAKLNISIASESARTSLRNLVDFTINM